MPRNAGWPTYKGDGGFRADPDGRFLTADGFQKSGRSLAGPLRTGTEPRVGPRASGPVEAANSAESDFGMDRVSPRDFDPAGTSRERSGDIPSDLITGQLRRRR
jgi:hypothetical protein